MMVGFESVWTLLVVMIVLVLMGFKVLLVSKQLR